jgi:serine/threonine-protein kinase
MAGTPEDFAIITMGLPDPVGTVVAERYRVLQHLSDGGMASVYLAEHVAVGRKLALKILHPEHSKYPDLVRRFLQEARAASLIRHAHIVDIIDVGITAGDMAYMAMELLEGEDLGTQLEREGPLEWRRLGPMVLQICDALGAAHAQGIVHRDVKPENCFRIQYAGAQDFIKLLDFGIAKDLGGKIDGGRNQTASGSVYGTAAYVAPESLQGKIADARVDIYALGVLMYELLYGKKPFVSDTLSGLLMGHLQTPPKPLHDLIPERVSLAVDAVVLRCLEKDPANRFQSMAEVARAVAATLDPEEMKAAAENGVITTGAYLAVARRESGIRPPTGPARAVVPAPSVAVPAVPARRVPWPRLAAFIGGAAITALVAVWIGGRLEVAAVAAAPAAAPAALAEPPPPVPRAPQNLPGPPTRPDPPEVKPGAPRPVRPGKLTEAAARRDIDRVIVPRARECLKTHTTLIKGQQFPVTVQVLPSGESRVTATLASSAAARCIAELFRRHRFPPSTGGLTVKYAFTP